MVAPILPLRSIASPSLPRLRPCHDRRPRAAPDRPTGPRAGVLALALALLAVPLLPLAAWGQAAPDDQLCRRVSASTAEQEERIAACSRVIASNQYPGARGSWAYNNRGLAYARLGQRERAIQDYDQAIRLDPNYASAYNNRAVAYDALEQYQRAIQDYDRAIRLEPEVASRYVNRALSYAALGQRERAIQDYDEAIRRDANAVLTYFYRGMAYAALGQGERAAQDYGQVIRLDPGNAAGYSGRCYALAVGGRAAEGLPDCERALELRPNDRGTVESRAYAYLRLGRLNEALRDYDAVVAAGSGPISRFGRAIVRAGLGDRAGATADLADARRLSATIDADAARISLSVPTLAAAPAAAAPAAAVPAAAPPSTAAPVAPAPVVPAPIAMPPAAPPPPAVDRDALFWQSIQASTTVGDFEAYLRRFPDGTFVDLARSRIAALRAPPAGASAAGASAAAAGADDLDIVPPQLSWARGAQGDQATTLVIEGVIRNTANAPRSIPPLRVIMRDGEVEVHSWTFVAAAPQVAGRAEVAYRTEIADPPQVTTLSVVFVTAR